MQTIQIEELEKDLVLEILNSYTTALEAEIAKREAMLAMGKLTTQLTQDSRIKLSPEASQMAGEVASRIDDYAAAIERLRQDAFIATQLFQRIRPVDWQPKWEAGDIE